MKKIDKKIQGYLKRADKMAGGFSHNVEYQPMEYQFYALRVATIAQMIQKEELNKDPFTEALIKQYRVKGLELTFVG